MSDTPRVDAMCERAGEPPSGLIWANDARQLERELNELRTAFEEHEKWLNAEIEAMDKDRSHYVEADHHGLPYARDVLKMIRRQAAGPRIVVCTEPVHPDFGVAVMVRKPQAPSPRLPGTEFTIKAGDLKIDEDVTHDDTGQSSDPDAPYYDET